MKILVLFLYFIFSHIKLIPCLRFYDEVSYPISVTKILSWKEINSPYESHKVANWNRTNHLLILYKKVRHTQLQWDRVTKSMRTDCFMYPAKAISIWLHYVFVSNIGYEKTMPHVILQIIKTPRKVNSLVQYVWTRQVEPLQQHFVSWSKDGQPNVYKTLRSIWLMVMYRDKWPSHEYYSMWLWVKNRMGPGSHW